MKFLADLPTTNLRVFVTILIVIATGVTYLWTGRESDGQWLAFLAVMSGLDAAQYLSKRATYKTTPPSPTVAAPPDREDVKAPDSAPTVVPPPPDQGED